MFMSFWRFPEIGNSRLALFSLEVIVDVRLIKFQQAQEERNRSLLISIFAQNTRKKLVKNRATGGWGNQRIMSKNSIFNKCLGFWCQNVLKQFCTYVRDKFRKTFGGAQKTLENWKHSQEVRKQGQELFVRLIQRNKDFLSFLKRITH